MVATPLGNLGDMGLRAVEVLKSVALVVAEDTRRSRPLLRHFGIQTPLYSFHEHNEDERIGSLLARLAEGQSLALISDAGTPLVSDPGFHLVREARARGLRVSPVPGPSAAIAALSVAGLPVDRFVFEGFLPARSTARQGRLSELRGETRTLVFYEAPHRVRDCLADMAAVLGSERKVVIARELTKLYESIHSDTLGQVGRWLDGDPNRCRGEFVILVSGAAAVGPGDAAVREVMEALLEELPPSRAVRIAVRLTGRNRNELYRLAQELVESPENRRSH